MGYIMLLETVIGELIKGMITTVEIFSLTLLFSIPLGLVVCSFRRSGNKILTGIMRVFISIMRGTPLMLQLIVIFFGPYFLFGFHLSQTYRFIAVIIAFTLNYSAYFAEIFRGGFESIPKGQLEAAQILGYSKNQTFVQIMMPQMFRITMPSITNETITLVKDTSLALVIASPEIFTVAKQIAAANASITILLIAGVFYYVFNALVAYIMSYIEKQMTYY